MKSCKVCKKKKLDEELNDFQECYAGKCYGTFMNKLRKGDKPMFPESKKKKKGWQKKQAIKRKKSPVKKGGGESWRGYNSVKKESLAAPIDESPTLEEEQSLTDKV